MAIGPLWVLAACDFPVILGQQARRLFEGFGEFAAVFIADAIGDMQDAVIEKLILAGNTLEKSKPADTKLATILIPIVAVSTVIKPKIKTNS